MGNTAMKCLSLCAVMLMLVIALVIGAADEPHDISSLEAASPTDGLESLSKEQLLAFLTGQNADKKQNAAHETQVADLKKQNAALKALTTLSKEQLLALSTGQTADLKKQIAAHEMQVANLNAAHEMQDADLKKQNAKQNAAHEMQNADLKKQNAALKARLDEASRLAAAKNDELGEQTFMQERFGFGGMMTSGSTMVQSSGFEEKKLGEVALFSNPDETDADASDEDASEDASEDSQSDAESESEVEVVADEPAAAAEAVADEPATLYVKSTLVSQDKVSKTNGMGPSACSDPFKNCNPALCEGQIPGFSGGLNCPPFASDTCPDDLSGLMYFDVLPSSGTVKCRQFNSGQALTRTVGCHRYETGRVCTKPAFVHPHRTATHVVAIMLKRLVCSGNPEKCFTHKMGYCISNRNSGQDPYFRSSKAQKANQTEYKAAYKMVKRSWTDIFDTENGGIRDEWACGDKDTLLFADVLMGF